jgi:hypothetical protein
MCTFLYSYCAQDVICSVYRVSIDRNIYTVHEKLQAVEKSFTLMPMGSIPLKAQYSMA